MIHINDICRANPDAMLCFGLFSDVFMHLSTSARWCIHWHYCDFLSRCL